MESLLDNGVMPNPPGYIEKTNGKNAGKLSLGLIPMLVKDTKPDKQEDTKHDIMKDVMVTGVKLHSYKIDPRPINQIAPTRNNKKNPWAKL